MQSMSDTFQTLAETAQQIEEAPSRNAQRALCSAYLRSLETDGHLRLAACFLSEGPFPSRSGKRISIGIRTYSTCAADFCEIDYEKVFKPCKKALGSSSATIGTLMQNIQAARKKRTPAKRSLSDIGRSFEQLHRASSRADKQRILRSVWMQMTSTEITYYIRMLSRESLFNNFGLQDMIAAIAKAFHKKTDKVRYAHTITGSTGKTAVLCKNDQLEEATFHLFHPISFMRASAAKDYALDNPDAYVVEEKLDGIRAQVHVSGAKVQLYSGDLDNITPSFPDVVGFVAKRSIPNVVLDGELCLFKDNQLLPVQLLQKRLNSNESDPKVAEQFPVVYVAYDLLYGDGRSLLREPFSQRRKMLEELSRTHQLPIINQFPVKNRNQVQQLLDRALAHGSEGLMFKQKDSNYECGQRSSAWLKAKKPAGTLNTVLMYVHTDSSKHGDYHSSFTLGINVKEDERYEEEFIPIGKINGVDIGSKAHKLNRQIKDLAVEKYGPTLGLIPEIVIKLSFDDIRANKRTKANYTLHHPRFKTIRWDLTADDANTLKEVEQIYNEKINRKRLKQDENPSFLFQ